MVELARLDVLDLLPDGLELRSRIGAHLIPLEHVGELRCVRTVIVDTSAKDSPIAESFSSASMGISTTPRSSSGPTGLGGRRRSQWR